MATEPHLLKPSERDRHGRPYGYSLMRQGRSHHVSVRNLVRLAFPGEKINV